jgi:hypothetical protein
MKRPWQTFRSERPGRGGAPSVPRNEHGRAIWRGAVLRAVVLAPRANPVACRHREEVGPTVLGSASKGCGSRRGLPSRFSDWVVRHPVLWGVGSGVMLVLPALLSIWHPSWSSLPEPPSACWTSFMPGDGAIAHFRQYRMLTRYERRPSNPSGNAMTTHPEVPVLDRAGAAGCGPSGNASCVGSGWFTLVGRTGRSMRPIRASWLASPGR